MPVRLGASMSLVSRTPFFVFTSYFFSCYAPQIVEQNLHIVQSRPIIQNATAQREPAAERRIGEIRTAVSLQRDQQALIERINCFRRFVPELRRHMTKTKDRQLHRRDHLE